MGLALQYSLSADLGGNVTLAKGGAKKLVERNPLEKKMVSPSAASSNAWRVTLLRKAEQLLYRSIATHINRSQETLLFVSQTLLPTLCL